ncbi:replication endonuclease [Yersinia ruckeri]|uniref:replication endonuclease n=1 Tax=Yersinia ruckeri TaxID=29486 RepID=UPI002263D5A6|nr:replication endonuclease [Yersinia ruckeri]UZX94729.1 replication endonuclease [Yersinia ruckeri]
MNESTRGRVAPTSTPPFISEKPAPFVGAYSWNAPREAIGKEKPLTRDEYRQGQDALRKISSLPHFLGGIFSGRHAYLLKNSGLLTAHRFLLNVFMPRIWPRITKINAKYEMKLSGYTYGLFIGEASQYSRLPGLYDKELKRLAGNISSILSTAYEHASDQYVSEHDGDKNSLFSDEAQAEIYGLVAGAARSSFNITPKYWMRYCKGELNKQQALRSIMRLVNEEWWIRKLKALRMQWREALLIAAGEVNFQRSEYASKVAIRDVQSRRLANLEYLKSQELENVETGERFDLIDKVLASISNPKIRRMELMSNIAGIEGFAASQHHCGLFVTITTPSKYHPTRKIGKKADKRVQLNHKWDGEAYSPKDGQRYLCGIWGKMRTAFKDRELKVYGMRVVEPHHDGTPHWHMLLFCHPKQRREVIAVMRKYALKEDGDERGAEENRFQCKHMYKGCAAGYIAKYIAKNIDGYALEGELDFETGKPLSDAAAAVTAWASIWRIPQFHPIGVPTMGAYRECRSQSLRGISLAESFDERVEAVRAAADAGDFATYIAAQGGANVPRDLQTVRVMREITEELNEYDEEVQKVVGIFAPHLGADHIHKTRETKWRIVSKAVDLDSLTLKSALGAPRSPVNNCGQALHSNDIETPVTPSEYAAAVIKLIESGDVGWDEPDASKTLRDAIKAQPFTIKRQQQSYNPSKARDRTPSERLTQREKDRAWQIGRELLQQGIVAERWELEALVRGGKVSFDSHKFLYLIVDEWPEPSRKLGAIHIV